MHWYWVGLAVLLTLSGPPAVGGQEQLRPVLTLEQPTMEEDRIPVTPQIASLSVPWIYEFNDAATAALASGSNGTSIHWAISCLVGNVTLPGNAVTAVTFVAGQSEYRGIEVLGITASVGTPGLTRLSCTILGKVSASGSPFEATGSTLWQAEAEFRSEIIVRADANMKSAGPHEQIVYYVFVENLGNSAVEVSFEKVGNTPAGWGALTPESLVLNQNQNGTTVLTVITKSENGRNSGSIEIALRAVPSSTRLPMLVGLPHDITLTASVHGWYIPSVPPTWCFLALFVAVLTRR